MNSERNVSVCNRILMTASHVLSYLIFLLWVYMGRMIKASQFYRAFLTLLTALVK